MSIHRTQSHDVATHRVLHQRAWHQRRKIRWMLAAVAVLLVLFWWFVPAVLVGAVFQGVAALTGVMMLFLLIMRPLWPHIINPTYNWVETLVKDPVRVKKYQRAGLVIAAVWLISNMVGRSLAGYLASYTQVPVAEGIIYGRDFVGGFWGGTEVHYLVVDLDKIDKPVVMSAPSLAFGQCSLPKMVQAHPEVVAAVNGDFFDEGGPQGFLVSSSNRYTAPRRDRSALTFSFDGFTTRASVEQYRFTTNAHVTVGTDSFGVWQSYNTTYIPGDVGIYTPVRGVASGAGTCQHLLQARVALGAGSEGSTDLSGVVTGVVKDPVTNLRPKQGEVIISAGNPNGLSPDMGAYAWAKANMVVGAPVGINLSVTPRPGADVISGGPQFLHFGHYAVHEDGNERFVRERTARTAVGITPDGRHLLVVVAEGPAKIASAPPREIVSQLLHRRLGNAMAGIKDDARLFLRYLWLHGCSFMGVATISQGMTIRELARYMTNKTVNGQPIYEAINLDGGSSSSMTAGQSQELVNDPMEAREPPLATGLGFAPRR